MKKETTTPASKTSNTPATAPVAGAPVAPALKKGPSPVFSIPATKDDKTFISLQSTRTGRSQKELMTMAIEAGRKQIEALPKYVEPIVAVKVKATKANEAEAALAASAKAAPAAQTPALATK